MLIGTIQTEISDSMTNQTFYYFIVNVRVQTWIICLRTHFYCSRFDIASGIHIFLLVRSHYTASSSILWTVFKSLCFTYNFVCALLIKCYNTKSEHINAQYKTIQLCSSPVSASKMMRNGKYKRTEINGQCNVRGVIKCVFFIHQTISNGFSRYVPKVNKQFRGYIHVNELKSLIVLLAFCLFNLCVLTVTVSMTADTRYLINIQLVCYLCVRCLVSTHHNIRNYVLCLSMTWWTDMR